MATHQWTPAFYGSLGKRDFYLQKMHWTDEQYLRYQEQCTKCCQLFLDKGKTGQQNGNRAITRAIREHVLGSHFDAIIAPVVDASDIDKFYHTTIFRFNTLLSLSTPRVSKASPKPEAALTLVELAQRVEQAIDEDRQARAHSSVPAQASPPPGVADADDLEGSLKGLDLHRQAAFSPTKFDNTSAPIILPEWGRSFAELKVFDANGIDISPKMPMRVPLGRLRDRGGSSQAMNVDTVDPTLLSFTELKKAIGSKCTQLKVDSSTMTCLSVYWQKSSGQKWYYPILDEYDMDTAFRQYQTLCGKRGLNNTIWPLCLAADLEGFNLATSELVLESEDENVLEDTTMGDVIEPAKSTVNEEPPVSRKRKHSSTEPVVDHGKRQRTTSTTLEAPDTTVTTSEPDKTQSELSHVDEHMSDISESDYKTDGIQSEPEGFTSDFNESDVDESDFDESDIQSEESSSGSEDSKSDREAPLDNSEESQAEKPSMKIVYDSEDVNFIQQSCNQPTEDDVSVDQWKDWSLQEWAAKGLSLNKKWEAIEAQSGEDIDEQFESVHQRLITEQLTSERLIEFHDVFGLKDNRPIYRHERFPIPGTTGKQAFAYQALAILFMESLDYTFLGGLLADMQGLGKTFQVLFMIVRRRYRNAVWRDIAEDRRRAREAGKSGEVYTPIHLPEDYDPSCGEQVCPMRDRRPYECPCEKKTESRKPLNDGFTLIMSLASATRDPWVNEWKAWFEAADEVFVNNGFDNMGFILEDKRPFKLVIAHDATLRSEADKNLYGWEGIDFNTLSFCMSKHRRTQQESFYHETAIDHIVILTTNQSQGRVLDVICESVQGGRRHQWSDCWPREIYVDEAHTYKSSQTAIPDFLNKLANHILDMKKETVQSTAGGKKVQAKKYRALPPVSVWLLTGTPFAGNFVTDFGAIWLPIFAKFHKAAGMPAWTPDSPFAPCNDESLQKMTDCYNRSMKLSKKLLTRLPTKGLDMNEYRARHGLRYVQRVMKALRIFTIKRDNRTRLWGEEVVDLPAQKCFEVTLKMDAKQTTMANEIATKRLVDACREAETQKTNAKVKGKPTPFKTSTLFDKVSKTPAVPVMALFPTTTLVLQEWNSMHSGDETWNLKSQQIGERDWWKVNTKNSPYTKYSQRVVNSSHKWNYIKDLLTQKLNVRSSAHDGFGKVIIVSRAGANILFLYPAVKKLAATLSQQWQRKEPIRVAYVVSQVQQDERSAIYELFNKGNVKLADQKFGHLESADVLLICSNCFGVGQNMGRATTMLILEPQTSAQLSLQLPARIRRVGGKEPVEVHTLVGKGCMADEVQLAQNQKNTKMMDEILAMKVNEAHEADHTVPSFAALQETTDRGGTANSGDDSRSDADSEYGADDQD